MLRRSYLSFLPLAAVIVTSGINLSSALNCAALADTAPAEEINVVSPRLLLKPGQPISGTMQTEDIVATYDVALAREQVAAFPDSPEASFVLAVALTRTPLVEEALHEVRRARKLAEAKGGPAYFDHMISEYEDMLKSYPNDNRVRYGLAWAYYMKAYVLTHYSKGLNKGACTVAANMVGNLAPSNDWHKGWVSSLAQSKTTLPTSAAPIKYETRNTWKDVPPELVPQVKAYYECALAKLDELLTREPDDMWAKSYRAFLYTEYTGDLQNSMDVWKQCISLAPNNPAAYFFLGESYLQKGNLKECLQNISKAVALRGLPN